MKCPHCNKDIHLEFYNTWVYEYKKPPNEKTTGYEIAHDFCPACSNLMVLMRDGVYHKESKSFGPGEYLTETCNEQLLYPKGYSRPVDLEVPKKYANDYKEAAAVKYVSPKASAAISRRILQTLLREECNIKPSDLATEIDEFIQRPGIPSYLSQAVDAIRNIGNFAAHPLKNTNTGEIVDVEEGEADWLLDVLDAMFDYLFVQPKRLDEKKKQLNEKLKAIGKPPMKGS